ncbi:MAG: hypothetical protein P8J78_08280 [Maricaulis sp.]|jgi:transposase-like protein|nr:hypothetical protein [Maricaulis sp.]MDG2044592.1 hypothetical protein [Maricaulis sp.]
MSPEIIRLTVMLFVHFPFSLRNIEDLLHERGIDIAHETVRFLVEPVRVDVCEHLARTTDSGVKSVSFVFSRPYKSSLQSSHPHTINSTTNAI